MESSPRFVGFGTKRREHDELHTSIGDLLQIYFLPNQCLNENKEHGAVFFYDTDQDTRARLRYRLELTKHEIRPGCKNLNFGGFSKETQSLEITFLLFILKAVPNN